MKRRRQLGRLAARAAFIALWAAAGGAISGNQFPPPVAPPTASGIPTPAIRTLPNGLGVMVVERPSVPLVTVHAMVMAGSKDDPSGLAGTAQFVAGLLTEGTRTRSAPEIARAIDQAGGTMDTGAGWDETMASVSVLADRKALAFELLSDILIHPAFAPSEMDRYRRQTISALRILNRDPRYIADTLVRSALLAGTSYAHPPEGTATTLDAITRQDLLAFHERYFRPGATTLAVLGDITPHDGLELAEKYFGQWSGRPAPAVKPPPAPKPQPMHAVILVNEPDAVETEIRIGYPGIARSSPAYAPLAVANQILGGPAGNRLFFDLRTELGLTYSASSALRCHRRLGIWVAKTSTRTDDSVKAVTQMMDQIRRIRAHPVSEAEKQMAQDYLVGHLALQFEPLDGVAGHFLELALYGLPLDYWTTYAQQVRAVTREEILRAASAYLRPRQDVVVLVGNAAGYAKNLKKFGPVKVIPLPRLDLGSPGFEAPAPGPAEKGAGRKP